MGIGLDSSLVLGSFKVFQPQAFALPSVVEVKLHYLRDIVIPKGIYCSAKGTSYQSSLGRTLLHSVRVFTIAVMTSGLDSRV